jgi:glyoxylase-like metal-dependent hydrolase (beta-lactamase superfamily II)
MTSTDSVDAVELRVVVAPVFGTNCCVVSFGTDCVVVDAGAGVADAVGRLVDDAGLTPRALHAPGHTEGSTLYHLGDQVVLTGDVLFAGSVGRTDLHGGSDRVMGETLRDAVRALDPALAVVPGHGPSTTVAHELETNPFLLAGRV